MGYLCTIGRGLRKAGTVIFLTTDFHGRGPRNPETTSGKMRNIFKTEPGMSAIPALRRLTQEACYESKASPDDTARPCLKDKTQKANIEFIRQ